MIYGQSSLSFHQREHNYLFATHIKTPYWLIAYSLHQQQSEDAIEFHCYIQRNSFN